jgi:hypothetical protein
VYRSFVANNVHHMVPRRSGVFLLYRGHVDMKVVIPVGPCPSTWRWVGSPTSA